MKNDKKSDDISLLGKIFLFFHSVWGKIKSIKLVERVKNRQKELAHYEGLSSPREARISYGFGIAKVICATALAVVLLISVLLGGNIISYENVYYMVKDIGYIHSYTETRPETLNFSEPVSNQNFGIFKGGLAVASDSEVKFFTSTGRVTMTQGSDYTNPKITCSDGNALIYDQGRKLLTVYNSFIEVYAEELEYPISSAHMCDNGSFVVVTKSRKYNSVVRIYDNDFTFEMEYSKNDYVLSARMSKDGRYVSVLSIDTESGESKVSLNVIDRKRQEVCASVGTNGVMPYSCEFISNDTMVVLCQDRVCIYNVNGDLKKETFLSGTLTRASFSDYGFAVILRKGGGSEGTVSVFDDSGKNIFFTSVAGDVIDIALTESNVYLLLDGAVLRIDLKTGHQTKVGFQNDGVRILAFETGEVMVCTPASAHYLSFD